MVFDKIRTWTCNDSGNIAIVGALTIPLFIGGVAFGTEASNWFAEKSKLSFATDSAAVSAGSLYNRGLSESEINSLIEAKLIAEGYPESSLSLGITYPTPTSDLMTVTTSYEEELYFSAIFLSHNVSIGGKTVVAINGKPACVLALNPTASGALSMAGSSSATLNGCIAASNSTSADSIDFDGSSRMTADCLISSGDITGESSATTTCQNNRTYWRETKDPFASLTQPATPPTSSCLNPPNFNPNQSRTLSPGCYKNDLRLKGTVTFESGVYILDGVDLTINANAVVNGTDVTFVLKNGANLSFSGSATINLSAPPEDSATEPYGGVLFWGAPDNDTSHKITGDSSSSFSGAMYFPDDHIEFTGTSGMDSGCARIIGDTVAMQGTTDFGITCTNFTGKYEIAVADSVVIVE